MTIIVPTQSGVTYAMPTGAKWWLLAVMWAAFALLAYATERLTSGHSLGVLAAPAVTVTALTGAAATGLTYGIVLLVVPARRAHALAGVLESRAPPVLGAVMVGHAGRLAGGRLALDNRAATGRLTIPEFVPSEPLMRLR